ncbi:hypothetical protein N656DRAFT_575116 [Canariomyces notabilis]|uniref:Uncharacterized protein n=1 Tax=Canariomyces notabilis TaxID=2074819 RepID=A0AAN6TGV7_9PEZI|nr:hypothetical protein N656DRAFT_575116 [Canariomyces arenarius]
MPSSSEPSGARQPHGTPKILVVCSTAHYTCKFLLIEVDSLTSAEARVRSPMLIVSARIKPSWYSGPVRPPTRSMCRKESRCSTLVPIQSSPCRIRYGGWDKTSWPSQRSAASPPRSTHLGVKSIGQYQHVTYIYYWPFLVSLGGRHSRR